MELFKLLGKIAIDNDDANKSIDDTTGKAEKSESKMSAAFKKIGAAVVAGFAVDKVVNFGKACINAAADVQAMNSQFSQVFGELEGAASKNLSKIADQAGIAENRMKGSYTKIAAFAKTAGMDTESALGLADRAMIAVADSAAFYDRSLEETTESLQSFLKGNYENDSALGLSCTETNRNAAANKLYGKSFKDLSEEQKQLTLLQMVEDANELSGAMGQAARESDTWTNQTGNLKQAWSDFQAVIGKPFLAIATTAVGGLADKLGAVTKKVGEFVEKMSDGEQRTAFFSSALSNMFSAEFIEHIAWLIDTAFPNLLGHMKDAAIEYFSGSMEKIQTLFDTIKTALQPLIEVVLLQLFDALTMIAQIVFDVVIPALGFLIDGVIGVAAKIWDSITPALNDIADKFQRLGWIIYEAVVDYIVPLLNQFIGIIRELWAENKDKINAIGELFSTVFNNIASIVTWFVDVVVAKILYPAFIWIVNFVRDNMDTVKSIFQSAFDIIGGIVRFFTALFKGDWKGMWDAVKSILQSGRDFVMNVFRLIKDFLALIGTEIWKVVQNAFENVKKSIETKINAAKDTVESVFSGIENAITTKVNSAKDAVHDAIEKIKSFFNFEWRLPPLKLPHITVSGSFSLNPPSTPDFGLEWYAKGGIMNSPTIFGINPMTGNAMVGGEAGAEAIAPIDALQGYVESAVARQNGGIVVILERILEAIISIDENMGGNLREALSGVSFEFNKREVARFINEVS